MKSTLYAGLSGLATLLAVGCAQPQVISGQAEQLTFPAKVVRVQATNHRGKLVSEATVAADGTFSLSVPRGKGYHLDFISETGATLVFPRAQGTLVQVQSTFDVRQGGATFDLGKVRFIGDPLAAQYTFFSASTNASDGECEDGIDAVTGAVCVDNEEADGEACDGEENDDGVDCVDGIDSATGAECDGGPSANQDDGEADDDVIPAVAAVADHNLPASFQDCGDGDGEENDD
jgi:hypothetical protein